MPLSGAHARVKSVADLSTKNDRSLRHSGDKLFVRLGTDLGRIKDVYVFPSKRYAGTRVEGRVVQRSTHSARIAARPFPNRASANCGAAMWSDEPPLLD